MKYLMTTAFLFVASVASACDFVESAVLVRSRPVFVQQRVLVERNVGASVNIVNAGRRGASVIQANAGNGGGASVNIVNQQRGLFGRVRNTQVIQATAGR